MQLIAKYSSQPEKLTISASSSSAYPVRRQVPRRAGGDHRVVRSLKEAKVSMRPPSGPATSSSRPRSRPRRSRASLSPWSADRVPGGLRRHHPPADDLRRRAAHRSDGALGLGWRERASGNSPHGRSRSAPEQAGPWRDISGLTRRALARAMTGNKPLPFVPKLRFLSFGRAGVAAEGTWSAHHQVAAGITHAAAKEI